MCKLEYLQLQKDSAEHHQLLTVLLTDYNREIAPEYTDRSAELAKMILDDLDSPGWYCHIGYAVAEDGGWHEIGFAWGQIDKNGKGFLREFYIKPGHRRRGYGTDMYRNLEQCFAGSGASRVWLTADAGAELFWQRLGFANTGDIAAFNDQPIYVKDIVNDDEVRISAVPAGGKSIDLCGIAQWAEAWDWPVGKIVAKRLLCDGFSDGDTALIATVGAQKAGFCVLEKSDAYGTDLAPGLTPFITAVYVDPKHRGYRISQKILDAACVYAQSLGFDAAYLISGERNFYEKYGFEKFAHTTTLSGRTEPIYRKKLV